MQLGSDTTNKKTGFAASWDEQRWPLLLSRSSAGGGSESFVGPLDLGPLWTLLLGGLGGFVSIIRLLEGDAHPTVRSLIPCQPRPSQGLHRCGCLAAKLPCKWARSAEKMQKATALLDHLGIPPRHGPCSSKVRKDASLLTEIEDKRERKKKKRPKSEVTLVQGKSLLMGLGEAWAIS